MTSEELSKLNYPNATWRKAHRQVRCRECGKSVRWVEKPTGYHVKLDWHPSSTGRWRINDKGIAQEMPPNFAGGHGMYDRHVCEQP